MSWVSRRYRARRKQQRERSGGEGPLAANGKSICMRYLPAAEVIRCAGFLLPRRVRSCRRSGESAAKGEGKTYGYLRNRIDGRQNLRRDRALCWTRARIFYRTRGSAQPRLALPVVARALSTASGQTQSGCVGSSREDGVERQRTGPRALPAE